MGSIHVEHETDSDTFNSKGKDVKATMRFMPRDPVLMEEKPYHIRYSPHGDMPARNFSPQVVDDITVRDIRPVLSSLTLDQDGLVVGNLKSKLSYEDFANPDNVIGTYLPELCSFLEDLLETKNVAVLEYLIRRRHASFPLALKEDYEYVQPVAGAHIDFSPECIEQILKDRYGESTGDITNYRYQLVTIWKPLKGPIQDWPLSLCLARSMDEDDLELMDLVYADHIEESISVYYSPKQDWVYLSEHMPDELLVFRGGDSAIGLKGGLPHCAFQMPDVTPETMQRESIEARFLVSWAPHEVDMSRKRVSTRHGPPSS